MRVVIVGAGKVGQSIASNLQASHDVIVIDKDDDTVEELTYSFDVLAVRGDGTESETLRSADIDEADLVIACTDSDESNVVICGAAKAMSDAFTIARVRRRTLLETWEVSEGAFGVDFMVCTDLLTARTVFRVAGHPAAKDVDIFASGLVRMAEFEIGPDSKIGGLTVREADQYDTLTFAGVFRDDDMIVAEGDTLLQTGDRIVVIGSPDAVSALASDIVTPDHRSTEEIVIVGASEIGLQAAREFEEHGYQPRLIEQDPDRAREAAEALPGTTVLESDATEVDFLRREHIDEADVLIATLGADEQNLLISLLARRLGVDRTVAVIENLEFTGLFEAVGIDVAINPREETAEEIIRFTRADRAEKIAMLEHDRAEVIEIEIDEESVLAGRQIMDSMTDLPDGVVIGSISRDGSLVTPRGTTVVEPGDHVVVFVDATALDTVVEAI
ncbi:Trk system potassium transporter TrkA [Natrononativus amylolyticus]|uniref:Trk system potassium transporter TrkA n=1 Tax=Natrononativus amylolyticus TaxID=2963434 RepID=UPI0020CE9737|nr:Trk system potassium transporter TrkA [Natrononativus amylolyticus]